MDRDWYELKQWISDRSRTNDSYDKQVDYIIKAALDVVIERMSRMETKRDVQSLLDAGY